MNAEVLTTNEKRSIVFHVDEDLLQRLNKIAKTRKMYRSEIIRDAIEEVLKKEKLDIPNDTVRTGIRISVKINREMLMKIDKIAIKHRMTRSDLIRIALINYLNEVGQ